MINYIKLIFADDCGTPSSKRWFAFFAFIFAIIFVFLDKDFSAVLAFLGFAGGNLGISGIEKFKK